MRRFTERGFRFKTYNVVIRNIIDVAAINTIILLKNLYEIKK